MNRQLADQQEAEHRDEHDHRGGVDRIHRARALELLRRHRKIFIFVTHDPRIADRCDRVIELVDGRVRSDRKVK